VARDRDGNITESSPIPVFVFNTIGRDGVIASWSLNEGSGQIIYDSTGNGHHGTIGTAAWAAGGRIGNALSFGGSSMTSIASSIGLELSQAITVEAWVKPAAAAGVLTVVAKDHGTSLAYGLFSRKGPAGLPNGVLRIACKDVEVNGSEPLVLNAWSHLALAYDGVAVRLFVNGVQVGSQAATGPIETSSGTLHIGGSSAPGQHFKGLIDEVRIYNRALSAAEITEDMTSPV
jgi:hypothetical protein